MSMSEPFLPAQEPRDASSPTDHDLDGDVDVLPDTGGDDPDADEAAARQRARSEGSSFRTPVVGDRLSADDLDKDLGVS